MGVVGGEVAVTALTHRGAVRPANEDAVVVGALTVASANMTLPARCVLPLGEPVIAAVADGLGGHAAGEIASEHAVHRMAEMGPRLAGPDDLDILLKNIDEEIQEHATQHTEFSGMGTTVAGVLLNTDGNFWFNVGDSRTYRLEGTRLRQISQDDSPPLPPSEDGKPVSTNFITQSLGGSGASAMTPHVGRDGDAGPGAWLMCSDGLSDLVAHDDMERIIAEAGSDEAAVHGLWQAAMEASGRDNISILLARRL
ncbi:serine/threonine-protein phosphatase [Nocardiopsis gilva YIM 90087]|uniref:Serine/threonine-protein phosphatase n=1 Tax=Nocardiopsis gilva YIM 90087 TaxID=1235441 RepID=A0A223S2J3_9ACTN|nr:protein phosphatase 2C domain-containing protein [Nocardiopsis gilva]ASU82338.1 serine/threonine-protein phosphatase [Nocardiopsis gilva YIM 90087]